jgi:hypothetical protein
MVLYNFETLLSVETTLAEALCRNKCRNDTPVYTVQEQNHLVFIKLRQNPILDRILIKIK